MPTDVEALPRTDEQRDLDPARRADGRQLAELEVREQHRPATLRNAIDDDPLARGLLEPAPAAAA
jgi:hypothetical protein